MEEGPYRIVKKVGQVNFAIENTKGVSKIMHHNNLKPAGVDILQDLGPTYGMVMQQPVSVEPASQGPEPREQSTREMHRPAFTERVFQQRDIEDSGIVTSRMSNAFVSLSVLSVSL